MECEPEELLFLGIAATFLAAFDLPSSCRSSPPTPAPAWPYCKGLDKSKALIRGKVWTAAAIFAKLNFFFVFIEVAFRAWVVRGASHGIGAGARLLLGLAMLAALCAVVTLALVVQTVVYLVCKSYHHESIDKSNLSHHLEVYLSEYVPLKASDVQMEQFHV